MSFAPQTVALPKVLLKEAVGQVSSITASIADNDGDRSIISCHIVQS